MQIAAHHSLAPDASVFASMTRLAEMDEQQQCSLAVLPFGGSGCGAGPVRAPADAWISSVPVV
jgi:hypothetical protein